MALSAPAWQVITPEEETAVRELLEEALSDGALGVSLGLGYAPEFEYDAAGLIRVLEPLRGTGIPLHVSHMKCIGKRNWHTGPKRAGTLSQEKCRGHADRL